MNRVERARHAALAAERSEDLASEIHLVDATDAPDEQHLIRSVGKAERPGGRREIPDRLAISFGVEGLNPAVAAIGDVDDVVVVDDETVWCVEIARLTAALTPGLHEIPVLVVLGDA